MNISCQDCGAIQYEGALFCSECGSYLLPQKSKATSILPFTDFSVSPPPPRLTTEQLQTGTLSKTLIFMFPGYRQRLELSITNQVRVGRTDPEHIPELDLGPFGGADKGVSRLHATFKLIQNGLVLIDLHSTNGTTLNANRLQAGKPYAVTNGDEIRFGDLLVHIFFE